MHLILIRQANGSNLKTDLPQLGPCRDSFARYAASRSVALLLTGLIALCVRSRMAITFLGIAMTVVQTFDGVIGALAREPAEEKETEYNSGRYYTL